MAAGGALLCAAIVWALGADPRGLGPVIQEMLGEPWSIVTLVDLYLGFFIAATLMVIVERRLIVGLLLAVPVFVVGNVWTALWLFFRLPLILGLAERSHSGDA